MCLNVLLSECRRKWKNEILISPKSVTNRGEKKHHNQEKEKAQNKIYFKIKYISYIKCKWAKQYSLKDKYFEI